jgi:hypothetical protein
MDRPEFKKVLERIEGQLSVGVIVARIDRFARTLVGGLQAIEDIEHAGGVVLTADFRCGSGRRPSPRRARRGCGGEGHVLGQGLVRCSLFSRLGRFGGTTREARE